MFCINCGTKQHDESTFCHSCGIQIQKSKSPSQETLVLQHSQPNNHQHDYNDYFSKLFIDKDEQFICTLESTQLRQAKRMGEPDYGFAVLSNKRVYIEGERLQRLATSKEIIMTEEKLVLEVSDIAHTKFLERDISPEYRKIVNSSISWCIIVGVLLVFALVSLSGSSYAFGVAIFFAFLILALIGVAICATILGQKDKLRFSIQHSDMRVDFLINRYKTFPNNTYDPR
jgi:hypothetical protein